MQQQHNTKTATTAMIMPVLLFFGCSGETGISFMISSPLKSCSARMSGPVRGDDRY
jgi:hypothetical protein